MIASNSACVKRKMTRLMSGGAPVGTMKVRMAKTGGDDDDNDPGGNDETIDDLILHAARCTRHDLAPRRQPRLIGRSRG